MSRARRLRIYKWMLKYALHHLCITMLVFLIVLIAAGQTHIAAAKQSEKWSPQQHIDGIADEATAPVLIADPSGVVHAFTYQRVGQDLDEIAIIYLRWTPDQGWTKPIDILLSPIKHQARRLSAYLDPNGIIHLVFFGGDESEAHFYYSQAPAIDAGNANAWAEPEMVAADALIPETVAITGDGNGKLVIVYSGTDDGNGLYSIVSTDSGVTWSEPTILFLTNREDLWPFYLRIAKDHTRAVNAVWIVSNTAGHGEAAYYARLDANYSRWTNPIVIAEGVGLGALTPNIVEYGGELLITYYNGDVNNNWLIRSQDNGVTWTKPLRVSPQHVGQNGIVSLAIDSNNILHLLFGSRLPNPEIHGMWHVTWHDGQLTNLEPVVSGPMVGQLGSHSAEAFDPSRQEATIIRGNILLVVWETDTSAGENGLWYSYSILDSPELPIQAMPQRPTPTATVDLLAEFTLSTPTSQQAAAPQEPQELKFDNAPALSTHNPAAPLVVGAVPVILVILIAASVHRFRHRG